MADETDVMEPMVHQDQEPGHESKLQPKPDWEPRYRGSGRLESKVALITGADSGIGRAVAALFAREGADVAILYLCEHDDAQKTKQVVEQEPAVIDDARDQLDARRRGGRETQLAGPRLERPEDDHRPIDRLTEALEATDQIEREAVRRAWRDPQLMRQPGVA